MEIVIIYRISDHSNPEKIKPGYGSKENCLKTLVREFGNKNLHIICDNVTKQTHEMVQKYSSNIELTNNGNTGAFLYSWNKATLYDHPDKYQDRNDSRFSHGHGKIDIDDNGVRKPLNVYVNGEETVVYASKSCHWKLTSSTTMTFATSVKNIREDHDDMIKLHTGKRLPMGGASFKIIEEYLDSLQAAISKYDGEVLVDFTIVKNEDLEKCISHEQKLDCMYKIRYALQARGWLAHEEPDLYTIADYRREFNNNYCSKVDVLMWGESDALIPKQTFVILDNLHKMSLQNNNPKYLAFFGTCKMWDDSWKSVEHVDFTDKPKNNKAWWGTRYITSIEEMNKINDKVEELDVRIA